MGQPDNTKHDPWANLREKKPVTEEIVSGDPWENVGNNRKPSYEEITKQVQDNSKRTIQTIVYAPSSPKRMEDIPKRETSNPWAGAPRSLWGKPKPSLRKILPYSVIRLGTLILIGANILLAVAFFSTYTLSNILLFGYLLPSTAVMIHYFLLMRYDNS